MKEEKGNIERYASGAKAGHIVEEVQIWRTASIQTQTAPMRLK